MKHFNLTKRHMKYQRCSSLCEEDFESKGLAQKKYRVKTRFICGDKSQ